MFNDVSVVVYHDLSTGTGSLLGKLCLSTEPDIFRSHVAYYAKNYDLISEEDLLGGRLPKRPLLITFDDAYRSVLTVGGPILREFAAPSLFFLISSAIASRRVPIDNLLSLAASEIGIDALSRMLGDTQLSSVTDIIARRISRMRLSEVAALKQDICAKIGMTEADIHQSSGEFLSLDDVSQFTSYAISVGNHSASHSYFRMLSATEVESEIVDSRRTLQELTGRNVRSISLPYGNQEDATVAVMNRIRSSGHGATFLVHARSNRFRPSPDTYYRVSLRNERIVEIPRIINILPFLRTVRAWASI